MLPKASNDLKRSLSAIVRFEEVAATLECAFDWIRHLSTASPRCVLSVDEFSSAMEVKRLAEALPERLERCGDALASGNAATATLFAEVSAAFDAVRTAEELFHASLARHAAVQSAKPPEGKRDWFEHTTSGAAAVRVPYQLREKPVEPTNWWNRPYRIDTARSFLADMGSAA
jgi:hypothetical protein